ncbi:hypothetical protein Godav_007395 [Gossypium davidsonii]|uniref:Longin domain-containing protein n=1 Tax=Gossypium davidsonii TaxID=34287 RepID=A0A7J8S8D0_GOSDV|nr:hypothetical protein [Gossypium davidsonii]
MISDPKLILYACIAKGPTVVAEFTRKEAVGIEPLARECIEKAPPYHSMFSHTVSQRSYTFLIDDPFVYFIISHEDLDKSESFWFLNRLKGALDDFLLTGLVMGTDNLTPNCLQSHFDPVFSEALGLGLGLDFVPSPVVKDSRNPTVVAPLLGGLKKKKRSGGGLEVNGVETKDGYGGVGGGGGGIVGMENTVDLSDDFRDYPVSMQKSGGLCGGGGGDKQKAKQTWRKHVWVVLILDLLVCATLFGVWLWVCRGLQCIDG